MSSRGSVALIPRTKTGLAVFFAALLILTIGFQYVALSSPRSALAADVVVTPDPSINGCEGVVTTPGSYNTNKRLIGGDLTPGGEATYEISFPVDEADVNGDFRITDCVYIDDEAALKFFVDFVPNNVNFVLVFTLPIPTTTELGEEFCNFAKTTESPSKSPASNRKAGPACFIVGGNISIFKENEAGERLPGATFHIECDLPTTEAFLPDVIINGESFDAVSGGHIETDATTGNDGLIAIQAPTGTECTITETEAPDGYDLPADPDVTLTATQGGVTHTFVDPKEFVPAPGLTIAKGVSLSAAGPFVNSLETTIGTTVHYRITVTNTGNVELTGLTLTDSLFPLATKCADPIPTTLAVGAHYNCNYTDTATVGTKINVATVDTNQTEPKNDDATVVVGTGSIRVTKVIQPSPPAGFTGTFGIRVSCTGQEPVNTTITWPDPGFVTIGGIPAGTVCVVIETSRSDPPAGSQWAGQLISDPVTIVANGTAVVTVTNGFITPQANPVLSIIKSNNAANPAAEGSTVTYALLYAVADGPVDNGVITDKLPAGVTYVAGSASSDAQFTFVDFNVTTPGALTWKATSVASPGTLTYRVTINKGAAALVQPLKNTATIDSDDTEPITVTSNVFVAVPPLAETGPPTDVAGTTDGSVSGGSLLLILFALAGLVLAIAFVAPTPAAVRKRR